MKEITAPKRIVQGVTDYQGGAGLPAGVEDPQLRQACQQFEEIFLRMLLKELRATVPKSGLLPQGLDREIFGAMLDENYARAASQAGGIGLADRLYQQLLLANPGAAAKNLHPAGRRS